MTPTANQIAQDILARRGGATAKQAAFIGRLLAPVLARQERHGVSCTKALYEEWISSSETKRGASENINMLTAPDRVGSSAVRG